MHASRTTATARRFLADYGMVFVLAMLCAYYSYATWKQQYPAGPAAAAQVAETVRKQLGPGARVVVAAEGGREASTSAPSTRSTC